jgi:citrate synthase
MQFLDLLTKYAVQSSTIEDALYPKYNVKRGLRNADHSGVLVGLTHIGQVVGLGMNEKGEKVPSHGRLYYRGIEIGELVKGFQEDKRQGFEETIFLLLFGRLANRHELTEFAEYLAAKRYLSDSFMKNMILSLRGKDMMNMLARNVLALYALDESADDTSPYNVLRQELSLIAKFPTIIAYSFHAYRHSYLKKTLVIRHPKPELSFAENFLYMLKGSGRYTQLEVDILDLALVLHAEHGGGNNSSFTTHVVSSSGTDTYSAIASALGSLKGPLHGGANLKVMKMMDSLKKNVRNWKDDDEISEYLIKLLEGKAYDKSGKIYGIGHAVYTLSDPRSVLLKEKAREIAIAKGKEDEFELLERVERLTPEVFQKWKGIDKAISPNVDFYSGFVYCALDIPPEVYTPIFAMARIVGWSAHRMEEIISSKRIIRPAYRSVSTPDSYRPLGDR